MNRIHIVFIGLLQFFCLPGFAQEQYWTLEECVEYAYKHNIDIKTQELSAAEKRITLAESKWDYAPSLMATNSFSLSKGRVLDETTYEFVENETMASSSTSIVANFQIFGGLEKYYSLKRAQLDLQSSLIAIDKIRNDVRLNITAYYLEMLCAQEMIHNAEQVVAELTIQEQKIAKRVEVCAATNADLFQVQSQLADAQNNMLSARNIYEIARLNLCQLLEIDDYASFQIVAPDDSELKFCIFSDSYEEMYEAFCELPELKIASIGVEIAHRDLQILRAARWPTLTLSIGYGSSYSDARYRLIPNIDGTYQYNVYPFLEQYKDNASSYLLMSLNIPIFAKLTTHHNVQKQKLSIKQSEYYLRAVEKQVKQDLMQIMIDARTAWDLYLGAQKYVAFTEESVRQISLKYDLGTATITDYNAAVSAYVNAKTQLLQTKYEYIFKIKMLTYYTNGYEK